MKERTEMTLTEQRCLENPESPSYVLLCRTQGARPGHWFRFCPVLLSWNEVVEFRKSKLGQELKTLIVSMQEFRYIGIPKTPEADEYFDLENQRRAGGGLGRNS